MTSSSSQRSLEPPAGRSRSSSLRMAPARVSASTGEIRIWDISADRSPDPRQFPRPGRPARSPRGGRGRIHRLCDRLHELWRLEFGAPGRHAQRRRRRGARRRPVLLLDPSAVSPDLSVVATLDDGLRQPSQSSFPPATRRDSGACESVRAFDQTAEWQQSTPRCSARSGDRSRGRQPDRRPRDRRHAARSGRHRHLRGGLRPAR